MNRNFIIVGVSFLLIYIFILASVITEPLWVQQLDFYFIHLIQSLVNDSGVSAIALLTDIGGTEGIIILTLIVTVTLFIRKMYVAGFWFGMTVLISPGILVYLMKIFIDRDRPDFLRLAAETSQSFPSGHSTASTVFFGLSGVILIMLARKLSNRIIIAIITFTIILFIMSSRIYLGVHFPTDVLGGFFFGAATVMISLSFYHLVRPKFQDWLKSKDIIDKSPSLFQ